MNSIISVNLLINWALYFVLGIVIVVSMATTSKNRFIRDYRVVYGFFLLLFIAGTVMAFFNTTVANQNTISDEIQRAFVLPLGLGLVGIGFRKFRHTERVVTAIVFFFVILSIVSRFAYIPVIGAVFKPSVAQAYSLSLCGFYGFYLLACRRNEWLGRFIIATTWLIAALSLAKWQFYVALIFPFLWVLLEPAVLRGKVNRVLHKRALMSVILGSLALLAFYSQRERAVQYTFAGEYQNYDAYWAGRVAKADPSTGRFEIWGQLLGKMWQKPFTGLGFGVVSRVRDNDVVEHNAMVFFLSRFGLPIFIGIVFFGWRLLRLILFNRYVSFSSRIVLMAMYGYYFFSASVGEIYSLILNGLALGIFTAVILNHGQWQQSISSARAQDRRIQPSLYASQNMPASDRNVPFGPRYDDSSYL